MSNPTQVLIPTDFSEGSDRALQYATKICGLSDASLHVLHANLSPADDAAETLKYSLLEEKNWSAMFRTYVHSLNPDSLKITEVIKREVAGISPGEVILQYARENDIDLIVMGTHGRRGLGRLLLGSTAQEVTRLSHCPVLTVGEKPDDSKEISIKRILVPVDFSDHSKKALKEAKELAGGFDAQLDLVHVIQDVAMPSSLGITYPSVATQEVHEQARKTLEDLASDVRKSEIFVADGLPAHEITKLAQEIESDLIVIATHGLTGFERFIMGSVTEKVLRLSPCPVYTVKSFA